jgi:fatty-acyl-CoA synthase
VHNVGAWLPRHAAAAGDRLAIVDAERRLDYAALYERTTRCADVLRCAGVGRGERVAIVLGNRSAYLELVFAAAAIGAIAVPVNARLTAQEIRRVLDDCAPRLIVHEADLAPTLEKACAGASPHAPARIACGGSPDAYEDALAAATPLSEIEAVSPDQPMILMYTSGTTGVPKGALLPQRKTLFNSLNAQIFFDLTRRDRVLVTVPLFHSFGLSILAMPALHAGATVFLQPRFDPEAVWQAVGREGITLMGGVPTQYRALLDVLETADAGRFALGTLRFLFSAGAALPVERVRAFREHGLVLTQGFGQTETSILCCLGVGDALCKAGSVGPPVFHAELRVVRQETLALEPERWADAAPGETGEIVVRGPIVFLGYWNQPEATREVLCGEWLRTGDLATVDGEGFVTLVGRGRDMYISGGENVYPAEVEAVFAAHPAVGEIAVIGVPDPKWGEAGCAFVVPAAGARLDEEALRAWGRERLAVFKLPRSFVSVADLPRTASGKVQKHRLSEPIESGSRRGGGRLSSR